MSVLPARLSIGVLAARSGLAASALRFYEDAGLLRPQRAASGRRWYDRSDLRRVAFVQAAQKMGLSLAEIRATLDRLPKSRTPSREDWQKASLTWKARLDQRLQELERLRTTLDGCIGCGCLSLDRCPIYNARDRVAPTGPGARFLADANLLRAVRKRRR
jgi:MerR family redox-sensitive transcriptional activator SoxR